MSIEETFGNRLQRFRVHPILHQIREAEDCGFFGDLIIVACNIRFEMELTTGIQYVQVEGFIHSTRIVDGRSFHAR